MMLKTDIRHRGLSADAVDAVHSTRGRGNYCEFMSVSGWYCAELCETNDGAEIWHVYKLNAPGAPRSRRGTVTVYAEGGADE